MSDGGSLSPPATPRDPPITSIGYLSDIFRLASQFDTYPIGGISDLPWRCSRYLNADIPVRARPIVSK